MSNWLLSFMFGGPIIHESFVKKQKTKPCISNKYEFTYNKEHWQRLEKKKIIPSSVVEEAPSCCIYGFGTGNRVVFNCDSNLVRVVILVPWSQWTLQFCLLFLDEILLYCSSKDVLVRDIGLKTRVACSITLILKSLLRPCPCLQCGAVFN